MNKFLLIISLFLLLASCRSNAGVKQQFQSILPSLDILSPVDNQVFEPGAPVKLELLTDLSFDENSTDENRGYARLILDNNPIILKQKTYDFKGIKAGTHTLVVELVHVSNVSYDVTKGLTFKIEPRGALIDILSPANNYATNKTSLNVRLSLENLDLNSEGYVLLKLNDKVQAINGLEYYYANLTVGDYVLKAEPYRNDNSSAGPAKSVSFKIVPTPPEGLDFDLQWPRENSNIKGDLISVSIKTSDNFVFGRANASNVLNQGHFHIFVNDAKKPIEVYGASTTIRNLLVGKNKLVVEMVQNDHSSYNLKKTVAFNAQTIISKS